jgi:hypothetical protein
MTIAIPTNTDSGVGSGIFTLSGDMFHVFRMHTLIVAVVSGFLSCTSIVAVW